LLGVGSVIVCSVIVYSEGDWRYYCIVLYCIVRLY